MRLLCVGARRNLVTFERFNQRSIQMSNPIHFIAQFAQALLAVAATSVSMLVLQFALLAG
jgi:hypothetical protein